MDRVRLLRCGRLKILNGQGEYSIQRAIHTVESHAVAVALHPALRAQSPLSRPLIWAGLLRMGALKWLAYRLSGLLKFIEFPLLIVVYSFLFTALYRSLPPGQTVVGGLDLLATITYVTLVWMLDGILVNNSDELLGNQMKQGNVAMYFLRPISLQSFMWWESFGEVVIRFCCLGTPLILLGILLFHLHPPASTGHLLMFLVSLLAAALLKFSLNFKVGISALFFENNSGVIVMKMALTRGLGGLVVPLSLLPLEVRDAILWTPFPYMYFVPVQVYLGAFPPAQLQHWLLAQLFWVLVLWGLGMLAEHLARRLVNSQGG